MSLVFQARDDVATSGGLQVAMHRNLLATFFYSFHVKCSSKLQSALSLFTSGRVV